MSSGNKNVGTATVESYGLMLDNNKWRFRCPQICNWFANWRRKLKNAGSEAQHRTWGTLIKSYNTQAQGNVEQFSLCSDDSIWEERELSSTGM